MSAGLSFLFALTESVFNSQVKNYFKFASLSTLEVLRRFQPFSLLTSEPKNSFLYQVSELDNADKHRVLARVPVSPVSIRAGRLNGSMARSSRTHQASKSVTICLLSRHQQRMSRLSFDLGSHWEPIPGCLTMSATDSPSMRPLSGIA